MKPLSAFYDLVLPELPSVGLPLADLNIRLAAREFCETTSAWRDALVRQDTLGGQTSYALLVQQASSQVARVLRVEVNGVLMWDDADLNGMVAKYPRRNPPFVLSDDLASITLLEDAAPQAGASEGLAVWVALQPRLSATVLPDMLLDVHGEAISLKAKSRLMKMGRKPWSDPQLAMEYERDYNVRALLASTRASMGNTGGPLRVHPAEGAHDAVRVPAALGVTSLGTLTEILVATAIGEGPIKQRSHEIWNYALEVVGSGTVSASARIEVSYDAQLWLEWGSMTCEGEETAVDTLEPAIGAYPFHRAVLTAISGVGAVAQVLGSGAT